MLQQHSAISSVKWPTESFLTRSISAGRVDQLAGKPALHTRPGSLPRLTYGSSRQTLGTIFNSEGLSSSVACASGRSKSAGSPLATGGLNAASTPLKVSEFESAAPEALQGQLQAVQDALGTYRHMFEDALAEVTRSVTRIKQLEQHVQ
jgi:hypothetical protein